MLRILGFAVASLTVSSGASLAQPVGPDVALEIMVMGEIIATAEGKPVNNPFALDGFITAAPTMYFVVRYNNKIQYCAVGVIEDSSIVGTYLDCWE